MHLQVKKLNLYIFSHAPHSASCSYIINSSDKVKLLTAPGNRKAVQNYEHPLENKIKQILERWCYSQAKSPGPKGICIMFNYYDPQMSLNLFCSVQQSIFKKKKKKKKIQIKITK